MESYTVLLATFILGAVTSAIGIFSYVMYKALKLEKVKERLMEEINKKATELDSRNESFRVRLKEAATIARTQLELKAQIEAPSKNALHSKWKSGLVSEIRDLEEKKINILKSVLAEGFDPTVTVLTDVGKEEIPLSQYLNQSIDNLNKHDAANGIKPETKTEEPATPGQPRRVGKFVIFDGGKGDGTTN